LVPVLPVPVLLPFPLLAAEPVAPLFMLPGLCPVLLGVVPGPFGVLVVPVEPVPIPPPLLLPVPAPLVLGLLLPVPMPELPVPIPPLIPPALPAPAPPAPAAACAKAAPPVPITRQVAKVVFLRVLHIVVSSVDCLALGLANARRAGGFP
jgi:hypothetical protein